MITIQFNGESTKRMGLVNFNRNTSFENSEVNSIAYLHLTSEAQTANWLQNYGVSGITHLQINNDDTPIYVLSNLNAHIVSMNEQLNSGVVTVSVNIQF